MRGLCHLRGWEGFSCVTPHAPHSSRAVTFTLLATFRGLSVSTHSRNLQRTVCSVPPWGVLQFFEHSPYLSSTVWRWITSRFLACVANHSSFSVCFLWYLQQEKQMVVICTFYPSEYSVVYVFCIILIKHDSKPTGRSLWDEALLINLQRRESFWLIDPISLKISWTGLPIEVHFYFFDRKKGLVRPKLYVKGLTHLSGANLSGRGWKKKRKKKLRKKNNSLCERVWNTFFTEAGTKGKKRKAFLAKKYFFSSAVHLD